MDNSVDFSTYSILNVYVNVFRSVINSLHYSCNYFVTEPVNDSFFYSSCLNGVMKYWINFHNVNRVRIISVNTDFVVSSKTESNYVSVLENFCTVLNRLWVVCCFIVFLAFRINVLTYNSYNTFSIFFNSVESSDFFVSFL